MVFANKPNKPNSKKLSDKRKISWLNSDFKILTGIENKRFIRVINHIISSKQYAQGKTKRISHAIALARDAIYASSQRNKGCAIADLDFKSAFDFLCMDWVFTVLERKGLQSEAIKRLRKYYKKALQYQLLTMYQEG